MFYQYVVCKLEKKHENNNNINYFIRNSSFFDYIFEWKLCFYGINSFNRNINIDNIVTDFLVQRKF